MTRPKLLIDCDPGHDDAVALLFGARHFDLVGVTTTHGNSSLANSTRNALAVLELGGIDVPVAAGFAGPLVGATVDAAHVHGKSGLDGHDLPPPVRKPVDVHAVEFIIESARRHQGELILAVIGPQTNVAVALRREPKLRSWLREITVMGGSAAGGNVTPAAEFNIFCDPEAAAVVFGCGVPIRMVGLDVTRRTGFDDADIARLRGSGRRVAGVIADLVAFYLSRQRAVFARAVASMHDVCALVPYVDEGLLETEGAIVRVECAGIHTRGATVCDLRGARSMAEPPVRLAVRSEARPLIDRVLDTLLTYS
ncbi:MAG: nucleoside hydrolase [Reyranellaceae bacterium]